MKLQLNLPYEIAAGWLAPWVDALRAGQALGARCNTCQAVSFPPTRVCNCGGCATTWQPLPGTAVIVYRTDGADGTFALVRFDGAASQSVVRLHGLAQGDLRGRLLPASGERPAVVLGPLNGTPQP